VSRKKADRFGITPSPLRGEGWGEGRFSPLAHIVAAFDVAATQDWPLTSILSPEGRGGEGKELFL
jgi:hypothetical protein